MKIRYGVVDEWTKCGIDRGEMDGTKNKREKMACSTVPGLSLVDRADIFIFPPC
jgi:hypothetical protein